MTSLRRVTRGRDQSSASHSTGKGFQNPGRKENEKYPALVEVFNLKQAAEYFTK